MVFIARVSSFAHLCAFVSLARRDTDTRGTTREGAAGDSGRDEAAKADYRGGSGMCVSLVFCNVGAICVFVFTVCVCLRVCFEIGKMRFDYCFYHAPHPRRFCA